ncbi:MAG: hypothetical protein IKQ35_03265 [Bacilli bacterium]|nr:hypothetical protein [Bacilli bacterium]
MATQTKKKTVRKTSQTQLNKKQMDNIKREYNKHIFAGFLLGLVAGSLAFALYLTTYALV